MNWKRLGSVSRVATMTAAVILAVTSAAPSTLAAAENGVPTSPASGTTWSYPDCGSLLQTCIDNAASGDTIVVAADIVQDDSVTISKGLVVKAAPDYRPDLNFISITASSGAIDVTVAGFDLQGFDTYFDGGSGHHVAVRNVKVNSSGANAGKFVTLVPASFELSRSTLHSAGIDEGYTFVFVANLAAGQASATVVGNRFDQHGGSYGASGIDIYSEGAGSVRADVYNNVVWDVGGCVCGDAASLSVDVGSTVHADVNVVGNTFERSKASAIDQRNYLSGGGHLAMDVFNNIFAHSRSGVSLTTGDPGTTTLRLGHNDFFKLGSGNGLEGTSPGTGNLKVDPKFVNRTSGNLRLVSSSPMVDAGVVCSPGGVADPDAAGKHRLSGSSVDLGAYEVGAAARTGIVSFGSGAGESLVGTSGADILCGNGGGDFLDGKGGNDYLDGGAAGDIIVGGNGKDRLFGRGGNDRLCTKDGVKGNDRADGGTGTDKYLADAQDVRVSLENPGDCEY